MAYRLPKGIASIQRNTDGPARFTGNFFRWISIYSDEKMYHNTRQEARDRISDKKEEREKLIREGEKIQAKLEFCN